jgi:hypothetical protein
MSSSQFITTISGPDERGRYLYLTEWEDKNPPYCLTCGDDPSRGCACWGKRTTRGQMHRGIPPATARKDNA